MIKSESRAVNTGINSNTTVPFDDIPPEGCQRNQVLLKDVTGIYDKFISAIVMSTLSSLARYRQYIPFSSNLCLNTKFPSQTQPLHGVQDHAFFEKHPALIAINVQWTSSETVLISSRPTTPGNWRNLEETSLNEKNSFRVPSENTVKLAPIGLSAMYIEHARPIPGNDLYGSSEHLRSSNENVVRDWKFSISRFLSCYGIELPVETCWIRAQTYLPLAETLGDNLNQNSSYSILWPAHLTFYDMDYYSAAEKDFTWAWEYENHEAADPLAEAELWFLGKAGRDEVMKEYRENAKIDANAKVDGSSSDEVSISGFVIDSQRPIDQQALTGIYPTPPDGYRSHGVGISSSAEQNDNAAVQISVGSFSEETRPLIDEQQQSPTSPDVDMALGEYDRLDDDDDLFGDMNTDMFTATGITEADFSFFDEPSNVDEGPDLTAESKPGLQGLKPHKAFSYDDAEVDLSTAQHEERLEQDSMTKCNPSIGEEIHPSQKCLCSSVWLAYSIALRRNLIIRF